jgi:glycosyltransferase involved in cell wall biosynthesis
MKKLTICIPTYNRSAYLDECLNSIYQNSNISNIEIIVSNNNSTDNTRAVVREHIKKNIVNIKYIENKNILPCLNWYSGVELVNTKYMMLLSDDDKLEPGFIDYFYINYQYNDIDCILFSSKDINNKGETLKIKRQKKNIFYGDSFIEKLSSFKIRYRLSSFIFKTEKIKNSKIFDYKWSGSGQFLDGAMIIQSSLNGFVITDPFIASAYRIHQDNDSYKPNFIIINSGRDIFNQYIKDSIKNPNIVKMLNKWIIYGYLIQIIRFIKSGINVEPGVEYLKYNNTLHNYHKFIIKLFIFIIYYANIININIRSKY